jgi:hypothetical protein
MSFCVSSLLGETARLGVKLWVHGDQLCYRPKSAVTPDLLETLTLHKREVFEHLRGRGRAPDPDPEREAIQWAEALADDEAARLLEQSRIELAELAATGNRAELDRDDAAPFAGLFPPSGPGWVFDLATGRLVILERDDDRTPYMNSHGGLGIRLFDYHWPDAAHGLGVEAFEAGLDFVRHWNQTCRKGEHDAPEPTAGGQSVSKASRQSRVGRIELLY